MDDASKDSHDCVLVEGAAVDFLQTLQHGAFAVGVAKWELFGLLERADFQRQARSHVQETQQFGIDFVNLFTPVFYVHNSKLPGLSACARHKKTSRDFQDRGWLVEGVVLFFRSSALRFKLRRSALPGKEEAVSKGEVEKCASAQHDLGYYRRRKNGCQDF